MRRGFKICHNVTDNKNLCVATYKVYNSLRGYIAAPIVTPDSFFWDKNFNLKAKKIKELV